jgi:hypothetical protein
MFNTGDKFVFANTGYYKIVTYLHIVQCPLNALTALFLLFK